MLICSVVQDLMPQYVENLISPETKREIDEHLVDCETCRTVLENMKADIPAEKAPTAHRDFLQKLNHRRLAGAVISAVMALACAIGLYFMEFSVDVTDTGRLEAALEEYNRGVADADVVETAKIGRFLYVLYLNEDLQGHYGFAKLERGIFGRYRFHNSGNADWPLYNGRSMKVAGQEYLLLYGIYDLPGVASYKAVDYQGKLLYEGAAESAPFLRVVELEEKASFFPGDLAVYYDENGNELDQWELLNALPEAVEAQTWSTGSAELFMVYVFMGIVLALGWLLVRYFLLP